MTSVELDLLDEIENLKRQLGYLNNNLSFIRDSAFTNKKAYELLEGNYALLKGLKRDISSVKTQIEKSSIPDLKYKNELKNNIGELEGLYNILFSQYEIQCLIFRTREQDGHGNEMVIQTKDPKKASSITAYTS